LLLQAGAGYYYDHDYSIVRLSEPVRCISGCLRLAIWRVMHIIVQLSDMLLQTSIVQSTRLHYYGRSLQS